MTTLPTTRPNQQPAAEPAYRKFIHACFAACIILAPLVIFLGFAFDPELGVPRGGGITVSAWHAANPLNLQLFLFFNVITPYFFPLSYLGLGMLALKRSPWLAIIGTVCGLAGSLPWPLFVYQEGLVHVLAQMGYSPAFAEMVRRLGSEWVIFLLFISWVVGHLLGYILLGIALGRARVISLWAACFFVVGVPLQGIAYPTHQGIFQLIGFALIFIASIPAALAMLKFRGELR